MPNGPSSGDSPNGVALFEAANKLRGSVESAEYKHLVLGLIFLKYISDSFEARREALDAELSNAQSDAFIIDAKARNDVLEDRDEIVGAVAEDVADRTERLREVRQAREDRDRLLDDGRRTGRQLG